MGIMITRKDFLFYNVLTIEQYYDLVIDARIRGCFVAAENLLIQLSKKQKLDAVRYFYGLRMVSGTKRRQAVDWAFITVTDLLEKTKAEEVESANQLKLFGSTSAA